MPGKKISDHQVLQYKKRRQTQTQVAAAASVGISERSARRVEAGRGLPSQEPQRHWRTRRDPLEGVWGSDLLPLLEASPHLSATTLFEELVRRQPATIRRGKCEHFSVACALGARYTAQTVLCSSRRNTRPVAKAYRISRLPTSWALQSMASRLLIDCISLHSLIPDGVMERASRAVRASRRSQADCNRRSGI